MTQPQLQPQMEIGQKLRHARHIMSLSQQDIADALGVTFQQVQKYENGSNRISVDFLQQLYYTFGINLLGEIQVGGELLSRGPLDKEEFELLQSYRNIKNIYIQQKLLQLLKAITGKE